MPTATEIYGVDQPTISTLVGTEYLVVDDGTASKRITVDNARKRMGGGAMFVVAASTAHATIKARADAVCSGTNDDLVINTWLAFGNVMLTDGDFNVSAPITLTKPGHGICGTGIGENMVSNGGRGFGTLIIGAAGFTGVAAIDVEQAAFIAGQCTVSNLKIDMAANKTANPGGNIHGLRFRSYQGNVDRVVVRFASGDGFNVRGYTTAELPPSGWSTYDTKLNMLLAVSCGGAGLNLDLGAADCHISNSIFAINDGSGVHGGVSVQATNVHTYGNGLHGWHLENIGSRHKLSNCKIEHNLLAGVLFEGTSAGSSGVQLSNCGFNCNGKGTDNTHSHIEVTGTFQATSIAINACEFGNSDGVANLAKYCIDLSNVGFGVTVTGCHFGTTAVTSGARTGKINASGNALLKLQVSGCNNMQDHHSSPAVTIAVGAGAGTSPPSPIITGNDQRGLITWGTGTSPASGVQATITFGLPWELAGLTVQLCPANQATVALGVHCVPSETTLTDWKMRTATAPAASQGNTIYALTYQVVS